MPLDSSRLKTGSKGTHPGPWFVLVVGFSLYWYGAFLSFPVFGEDGAANYSFLLENLQRRDVFTILFPLKWLEGLGQSNAFVTVTFDPFSWIMLLPLPEQDSFRISMALRALSCWGTTYLFVSTLFKGRRDIGVLAAFLNFFLTFIFGHPWGIPTIAGIPNATHYALFPLLLYCIVLVIRQPRFIGWLDVPLVFVLALFLVTFPLSAIVGLLVAITFLMFCIIHAKRDSRYRLSLHATKIVALAAVLLFFPLYGLWHAWSSLVAVSARVVFADELYSYGRAYYYLPYLWHDVPVAIRLCVLFAVSVVLYSAQWPRAVRIGFSVVLAVVGGTQVWSILQVKEIFAGILDRLPRPHYLEFYLPPFYALLGGFAIRYCARLVPRLRTDILPITSLMALFVFLVLGYLILRGAGISRTSIFVAVIGVSLMLNVYSLRPLRPLLAALENLTRFMAVHWRRIAMGVLGALAALWLGVWFRAPQAIYPLFATRCESGLLWCKDEVGVTIGAQRTLISDFLYARIGGPQFNGRAETLLTPRPRIWFPANEEIRWSPELFELFKRWYAVAHQQRLPLRQLGFRLDRSPEDWTWRDRDLLREQLNRLFASGVYYMLPDELLEEVIQWAEGLVGARPYLEQGRLHTEVVTAMIQERTQAFLLTGNGMMLRALPLHGIPVASSYEQSLDFLYYLLWTRYLNEGGAARYGRSINFTALEVLHANRAALLGIRYVIQRQTSHTKELPLPRVFAASGYVLYEVPSPNVAGYSPVSVIFTKGISNEVAEMRDPSFDPRRSVVVSEIYRQLFKVDALAPLKVSEISTLDNELIFEGESGGELTLAVLPFKFSNCWVPNWRQGNGHVIRANVGLIGVVFTGRVSLTLKWTAGYTGTPCLREDRRLIPEAVEAAVRFAE